MLTSPVRVAHLGFQTLLAPSAKTEPFQSDTFAHVPTVQPSGNTLTVSASTLTPVSSSTPVGDVNVTMTLPAPGPTDGSVLNPGADGALVGVGLDARVCVAAAVAVGASVVLGL